ncbi:MAG: hypothetical protein ABIB71_08855 [Candidatus Woesearchaeota archaeon]
MKIQKIYRAQKPKVEGPYEHYGSIICEEETAREEQHLARFVEEVWYQLDCKDYVISFVPGISLTAFWVNAKTEDIVANIIDDAVSQISKGLKDVKEVSDLVK